MLALNDYHLTQSTVEVDGNVTSFVGILVNWTNFNLMMALEWRLGDQQSYYMNVCIKFPFNSY